VTTSTKREAQAQERRNQLIDVARRLFAEKGMERTSIRDIADAAGVAPGLIYHYFENKDALFWAIIERHNPLAEMTALFAQAETLPVREFMLLAATRGYALMGERQDLLRIVFHEALSRPEMLQRIRVLQQMGIALLVGYLNGRIAAGELRPHNAEATARMLVGSILALRLTGAPAEPYITDIIDNLLCGVAAP
jgi:AcrR family transcriptional regulator